MAKSYCVVTHSTRLDACFEKKESAFQYARTVSRLEGRNVRVIGLGGARRRRRRRR